MLRIYEYNSSYRIKMSKVFESCAHLINAYHIKSYHEFLIAELIHINFLLSYTCMTKCYIDMSSTSLWNWKRVWSEHMAGLMADRILYPNRAGVIICIPSDRLWKSEVENMRLMWVLDYLGLERLKINGWLGFIAVKSFYFCLVLNMLEGFISGCWFTLSLNCYRKKD